MQKTQYLNLPKRDNVPIIPIKDKELMSQDEALKACFPGGEDE